MSDADELEHLLRDDEKRLIGDFGVVGCRPPTGYVQRFPVAKASSKLGRGRGSSCQSLLDIQTMECDGLKTAELLDGPGMHLFEEVLVHILNFT